MSDPASNPAVIRDRGLFLAALQHWAPNFWEGLRTCALRDLEAGLLSSDDCEAYAKEWAMHVDIVDDWLIRVIRDTLRQWLDHPEHPGSQLRDGYRWFIYAEEIPLRPFSPTFDRPYPLFSGQTPRQESITEIDPQKHQEICASQQIEPPDKFARRMKKQFNAQLTEHKRYLRNISTQWGNRPERSAHAQWTALLFSESATVGQIAENWSDLGRNQDSYATVYKAIKRYATGIGLSLRKLDKNRDRSVSKQK
jgi:hypothetical protein